MRRFVALSAVVVLLSSATLAHATFFDFTSSFLTESSAGNYSQSAWSPWTHGYLTGSTLTTFGYYSVPIANLDVWDANGTYDTYGHVCKNVGSAAITQTGTNQWEAGQTCMMNGTGTDGTDIRWTAPAAGTYHLSGLFTNQKIAWVPTSITILQGSSLFSR